MLEEIRKRQQHLWDDEAINWDHHQIDKDLSDLISMVDKLETRCTALFVAIRDIPYGEYGEALRDGDDHDGAWDAFIEASGKHFAKALAV